MSFTAAHQAVTAATYLADLPSPTKARYNLGPIPIRMYAMCILAGILVAVWLADKRWRARGGRPQEVVDIAIWAVPFGLVGGRLSGDGPDWACAIGWSHGMSRTANTSAKSTRARFIPGPPEPPILAVAQRIR